MRALRALAVRYPVRTTFVVALTVRLMVVIISHVLNQWPLIPDEMGYVELATLAADGRTNDYCCGGYGNALYQSTKLFTWQIHGLVELFGPVGWILQLPAVIFGVATAALIAWIASKFVSPQWALSVGLVMALMPSAVLLSSVVLRESLIWLLLALAAWLVIRSSESDTASQLVLSAVGLLLIVVLIGWLRDQIALVVAWSLILPALLVRYRRRLRIGLALLVVVAGPWFAGAGPAGFVLIENVVPKMATVRTWMSLEAESAISEFTVVTDQSSMVNVNNLPRDVPDWVPDGTYTWEDDKYSWDSEALAGAGELVGSGAGEHSVAPESGSQIPTTTVLSAWTDLEERVKRRHDRYDEELAFSPTAGAIGISERSPEVVVVDGKEMQIVIDHFRNSILVDNSVSANLLHLPKGLAAWYFRPFPWEGFSKSVSLDKQMASLENVIWTALYLLAAFGVKPLWKKQPALSAFIWAFFGATGLTAALTQGNLGTAFRHRVQVLWLVVLLAGVGGEYILHRRQQRRIEV